MALQLIPSGKVPKGRSWVACPLESVSSVAGSNRTPVGPWNSTRAPATAVPLSSLTCTTNGSFNAIPLTPICLPPLDSTIAVPDAVGFNAEGVSVCAMLAAGCHCLNQDSYSLHRSPHHGFAPGFPEPFRVTRKAVRERASSSLIFWFGITVPGRSACGSLSQEKSMLA